MAALVRTSGVKLAATSLCGLILFASYCGIHAAIAGLNLPWSKPLIWGLIAGVPAGAAAFLLCHVPIRAGTRKVAALAIAVLGAATLWGILARGVIGPGRWPTAQDLALEAFIVLPVAAALAIAAALIVILRRSLSPPTSQCTWIELPEEPLLRLRAEDVTWVSAAGNYCELHTSGRTHLVRIALSSLAQRLERHGFARVHRSALVNLGVLMSVERSRNAGRPVARLRCGTIVPVGKSFEHGVLGLLKSHSSRQ